jgi:hypothetical protein
MRQNEFENVRSVRNLLHEPLQLKFGQEIVRNSWDYAAYGGARRAT